MALSIAAFKPDYPVLFRNLILQTLKRSLGQVQQSNGALPLEVREQALHTLTFGLKLDAAWPLTRTLLIELAPKLEQLGHRDDWLLYLEQGIERSRHCADLATAAELHLQAGYLHRLCSRFALAQSQLTASVETFTTLGQPQGQARALNHLAYLAWQQHSYADAEQFANDALALLDDCDPERASSFTTLGEVARMRQQWQAAQAYHQRALQIRIAQHDQRRAAWSLQNLGHTLRQQGRLAETISYYQQALAILAELHDTFHWAITAMNLAILYYQEEQFDQALAHYTQAEAIFRQTQSTLYLAKIAVNKGLVFLALQDWPQAEIAFTTSTALFRQLNDLGEALNAQDGLGLTYLHQGRPVEAAAIFAAALQELSQIGDRPIHAMLHQELSAHLAQAQPAQAATAL